MHNKGNHSMHEDGFYCVRIS